MSDRKEFEILCVTMYQKDFSKIKQMNIHSNVVFANQADETSVHEVCFDGVHMAKMITTDTRGVGVNRNLALMYATGEICLFADDDLVYADNVEQIVIDAFRLHPDADIIVFNIDTADDTRIQKKYAKTRKLSRWNRLSFGGARIAFRLDSIRKANLWFSTLFGGGCIFPSGEDSMWLTDARKAGLQIYVSDKTIGTVSFTESTWFTGFDEKLFYGKGAFYAAAHPKAFLLWAAYFSIRSNNLTDLSFRKRVKWLMMGRCGYINMQPFCMETMGTRELEKE